MSVLVDKYYLSPWVSRYLAIRGVPGVGIITEKQIVSGRFGAYIVRYEFSPAAADGDKASQGSAADGPGSAKGRGAGIIQGKMEVRKVDWDWLSVKQAVTVLYREGRPRVNVVYECGDYEVSKQLS